MGKYRSHPRKIGSPDKRRQGGGVPKAMRAGFAKAMKVAQEKPRAQKKPSVEKPEPKKRVSYLPKQIPVEFNKAVQLTGNTYLMKIQADFCNHKGAPLRHNIVLLVEFDRTAYPKGKLILQTTDQKMISLSQRAIEHLIDHVNLVVRKIAPTKRLTLWDSPTIQT